MKQTMFFMFLLLSLNVAAKHARIVYLTDEDMGAVPICMVAERQF